MPNWVTNIMTVDSQMEEIKKFIKSDESEFDFNNIIPRPKELDRTSPFRLEEGEKEEDLEKIKQELIDKYGACEWYDWSIKNWNTKWNATDIIDEIDLIEFNTAWSTPVNIIKVLSEKFPEVEFKIEYADEDIGSNCGTYIFKNGEMIFDKEGDLEFACHIRGYECSNCSKCGKQMINWDDAETPVCYECQEKEEKKELDK